MEDLLSKSISENFNLPKTEEAILELWETLDAFHTSLELSKGREPYKFYDGPPFATGILNRLINRTSSLWSHISRNNKRCSD